MPTPKKKLPTGPIRIEPSVAKRAEVSTLQAADFQSHAEQEDSKAETRKQDSSLVESTKEETSQPESTTTN